jgi:hypothetical protein
MRNDPDKSCRVNLNTYFMFSNIFLQHRVVDEIMWKSIQKMVMDTADNMAHAHCMLDTYTHSGCVILICFSTATMVERKRLDLTLYVHCLSCNSFRFRAMTAVFHRLLNTRILRCTEMWQGFRAGCWEWRFHLSYNKWGNRNSFMTNCALHEILFGWSNEGRRDVWGIKNCMRNALYEPGRKSLVCSAYVKCERVS